MAKMTRARYGTRAFDASLLQPALDVAATVGVLKGR